MIAQKSHILSHMNAKSDLPVNVHRMLVYVVFDSPIVKSYLRTQGDT